MTRCQGWQRESQIVREKQNKKILRERVTGVVKEVRRAEGKGE